MTWGPREALLIALDVVVSRGQDVTVPRPAIVSSHDIMALHQAWTAGDTAGRGQLVIVIYRERRHRIAAPLHRYAFRLQLEGTRREGAPARETPHTDAAGRAAA